MLRHKEHRHSTGTRVKVRENCQIGPSRLWPIVRAMRAVCYRELAFKLMFHVYPDFSAYVAQKNRDGRERPHRADPQVRKAKTTSDRVCARSGCRTKNWLGAGNLLKLANREVLLVLWRKTHDSRRNWGGGFWHTGPRRSPGASSARWRPSARPSSRDPRAQRRRPRSRPPPASSPRRPSYTGRCQYPPPRAARS